MASGIDAALLVALASQWREVAGEATAELASVYLACADQLQAVVTGGASDDDGQGDDGAPAAEAVSRRGRGRPRVVPATRPPPEPPPPSLHGAPVSLVALSRRVEALETVLDALASADPPAGRADAAALTQAELDMCKAAGWTPDEYRLRRASGQ